MTADDSDLLRRYAETRDESAFTELVGRYLNLVYFAALRQVGGDAHRAEDVAQTVFTLLARKAASLARHQALAGWLHTTTRFVASETMRAERRRLAREQEAHAMHESSTDPLTHHEWEQLRPVLDAALGKLNAPDREAVLLRFFANLSFADVGARLHIAENAARMRVDRALVKLHAALAQRGVTSTAAALAAMLEQQAVAAAPANLTAAVCATAFAQTAVVGGGGSNILTFMSTTKFTAVAAAALMFLAIGTAMREVFAHREAAASLAAAAWMDAALSARLRDLERRTQVAEQNLGQLQQNVGDAAQAAKAAAAVVTPTDPVANGRDFLAQHPEAVRLVTDYFRVQMIRTYQALFKTLELSPQQIEQFIAIMVQANAGARWNTDAQAPFAEFAVGEKWTAEERDSRLRAVLGDAGYERYSEFRRAGDARGVVEQVAGKVNYSDAPLTAAQAKQLTAIMVGHSPAYRAGRNFNLTDFDWSGASEEAAGMLGPKQLAALNGVRDQIQFSQTLNRAVGEAMKAAKQAAGVPPNF